jgi:hypothetical protein
LIIIELKKKTIKKKMPKVFISYSRRNCKRARKLARALKNRGIDVWFDEWELLVGHNLFDEIYKAIREAAYLAVILTKQSVKSKWVKEELDFAKQEELERGGTKILPLYFEKCNIPYYLKSKKYANFIDFDKGMEELVKSIIPETRKTISLNPIVRKKRSISLKLFQNIESISPVRPGCIDDLFICCLNFEERSLWSIKNYPLKSISKILLFNVGEFSVSSKRDWYRNCLSNFIDQSRKKLVKNKNLKFFNWKNFYDSKEANLIKKTIQESIDENAQNIVSIDISGFPQPYFLQLLSILEEMPSIKVRVFYVSPGEYYPGGLTIGIKEIQMVPYRTRNLSEPTLLIILPGFSGDASMAIHETIEPTHTVVLVPYFDLWEKSYKVIKKTHRLLSEYSNIQIRKISSADPFSVEEELEKLKFDYGHYYWIIATQGTKLQSLGIHFFSRNNKEVIGGIIWAKPARYLNGFYSKGIGEKWVTFI